MPFILISFDFGNTSSVAIHAITNTQERGEELYARVLASMARKETLLELLEVPFGYEDYVATCDEGRVLFWNANPDAYGIRMIRSNNRA